MNSSLPVEDPGEALVRIWNYAASHGAQDEDFTTVINAITELAAARKEISRKDKALQHIVNHSMEPHTHARHLNCESEFRAVASAALLPEGGA